MTSSRRRTSRRKQIQGKPCTKGRNVNRKKSKSKKSRTNIKRESRDLREKHLKERLKGNNLKPKRKIRTESKRSSWVKSNLSIRRSAPGTNNRLNLVPNPKISLRKISRTSTSTSLFLWLT
jgi:hypothetical protein